MEVDRREEAVRLAQHVLRTHVVVDRQVVGTLRSHGLSRAEFDVLAALVEFGGVGARPRALSSRLLLTTGGLSNIFRRLQQEGLISRTVDPGEQDARGRLVRLTPRGRGVARRTAQEVAAAIAAVLSEADTQAVRDASSSLHAVLVAIGEDQPVHRDAARD
ncbi:MarR family transcriptional regulator [Phycicoccus sp. CSK15P-2]|uniref:MarR family winged helix-turn-helix transcriptional regulator n=1 Tax=Phycicoccus sp. CSK15P-2 TaxID=2807627 RepID=UPI0019514592|nr:MarR family transcriptional regulator [Phycicoccus sp. CSK15P-2]MBM6403788.1 MarR family transcriptional regulator [Phycicoccus sp. CSK15P-2]